MIALRSLLLVLLTATVSESRTWRRPTTTSLVNPTRQPNSRTTRTTTPWAVLLRGGEEGGSHLDDDSYVPQVPDSTSATTNVQARGGSTATKKPLSSSSSSTGSASSSSSPPLITSPTHSIHTSGGAAAARTTTTTKTPVSTSRSTTTTSQAATTAIKTANKLVNTSTNSTALSKAATVTTKADRKNDLENLKPHKRIAKKLRGRNARNLRRKVMHASFGFFFAALNQFIPRAKFVPGMTLLTSATLVMELLRYRKGFHWMNDILHLVLGQSLRKHEMDGKFTGSFYYFLGVTVTSALYPTSCATLGICQLAIADPTASFFGRATRHVYWSRIENGLGGLGRNKGILGFIGGALACVPMNYRLLSKAQFAVLPTSSALWTASLALGFAGAFADLAVPTPTLTLPKKVLGVKVPPFHIDDNFVVPVFSGFACQYIFKYLHFPADLAMAKFVVV